MKHQSITMPTVQHDDFNIITELIFLNKFGNVKPYAWREEPYRKFWSSTLAIIRKLNKVHSINIEQLAFYIYRCSPDSLSNEEFAKAAVVAKKLFLKFNLNELLAIYRERYKPVETSGLELVPYIQTNEPVKETKKKTLFELLKELENGQS